MKEKNFIDSQVTQSEISVYKGDELKRLTFQLLLEHHALFSKDDDSQRFLKLAKSKLPNNRKRKKLNDLKSI